MDWSFLINIIIGVLVGSTLGSVIGLTITVWYYKKFLKEKVSKLIVEHSEEIFKKADEYAKQAIKKYMPIIKKEWKKK